LLNKILKIEGYLCSRYDKYFPWKTREEAIEYELKSLGITCEKLKNYLEGVALKIPPILYKKIGPDAEKLVDANNFINYPMTF
jgi:hypothetical protein